MALEQYRILVTMSAMSALMNDHVAKHARFVAANALHMASEGCPRDWALVITYGHPKTAGPLALFMDPVNHQIILITDEDDFYRMDPEILGKKLRSRQLSPLPAHLSYLS